MHVTPGQKGVDGYLAVFAIARDGMLPVTQSGPCDVATLFTALKRTNKA